MMIPPGTRIYDLKGLEEFESADKKVAEELERETSIGWENLSGSEGREESVEPEREAELGVQYDEEKTIKEEGERRQLIKDLTEGKNGSKEVRRFGRPGEDVSEGKISSALEPFSNER